MINEKRVIDKFINMAKISSPSLNERKMGDFLISELKALGLEVTEDDAGEKNSGNCGNIIGVLKSNIKNAKKIMFSSHMDTVLPCKVITPIIDDKIIKTDGSSVLGGDDKSGIAAILEALETIKDNHLDHPEIIVVFSIGEEIGLLGAQNFAIEKYKPDFAYVLDSGGKPGCVVVKAPNSASGELKIIGKPAHAGMNPENGINALYVASQAISKMKLGRIDPETTSNIGIVRGGNAGNIVMPDITLTYEARSFSEDKLNALLKETMDLFDSTAKEYKAKFENNVRLKYSGFTIEKGTPILAVTEKACKALGLKYEEHQTGGGSDANVYYKKGFTTLNLATGMSNVHTTGEYIEKEDIINISRLVFEIIKELGK